MNAAWTLNLYPATWRSHYQHAFRRALANRPATIADTTDLVLGAGMAHLRPSARQQLPTPITPAPPATPRSQQPRWMAGLWGHFILFIIVNMLSVGINLLTTSDNIWFPYVIAGTGIALALHTALTWPGPRGLWGIPLATGVTSVGLVIINLTNGGSPWSIWPVWALASITAVAVLFARNRITPLGAHTLLIGLGGIEVVVAAIASDANDIWKPIAFVMAYAISTLLVHAWYRLRHASLLQAHTLLFALTNALLALEALTGDESAWWFVIPLASWGILLAAHAVIAHQLAKTPPGAWEQTMLASFSADPDRTARARNRARRFGLKQHLVIFGVGAAIITLVNLLTLSTGWWLVWPLSAWLVVLAAHIGMLAISHYPNLGVWIFGGGAAAIWIYVLDRTTAGGPWWFWPVGAWAVLTPIMASLNINLLALISTTQEDRDTHNALS